ncbi:C-type lectin domain-containing protein [Thiothrix unzii]|uniref:C-type lectin domain-containing protein n=1 Tax=Thiothrix unzii TaxID=111769 RepID=A0A975FAH4_9GAMM|nr:C-type lectin domain-containing protein [Thiothrix unzii]QTR54008.1 C-type lectin domain-containing protein [Thiothrix unzii]
MFKMKPIASSIALSLMTGIAVAAAPGGAILQNKVIATYSDIGGKTYTAESNIVEISIREVRTATLTITSGAEQQVAMIPSSKVYSVHTLTNNGNVSETYTLAAANVTGSDDSLDAATLKVYLDANGNGVLDSGETTPITSTTLAAGASAKLIVESVLPAAVALSDKLNVTLDATDSKGTAAASTNTVKITFKNSNVSYTPVIWEQAAGGNCHAYAGVNKALSYLPAKADAEASMFNGKMGHLATITSAAENTFVKNAVNSNNNNYWIGAKRTGGATSPFAWVTGEAFSYTNWMSGQPDNAGEDALAWRYDGVWHDVTSSASAFYVIEFDIDCPLPAVAVELEGAKDIACDGTADTAFGTAKLEDMYSGECAILRSRATNNGKSLAKNVLLNYTVPTYASYLTGSIKFDGTDQTDAVDEDAGKYDASTKRVSVLAGDLAVDATSPYAQFSVKID